jgi:glutamine amidotransferase
VKSVVVLDYGSGNLRSAQRALERAGAQVEVTAEPTRVLESDGLVVPGVGAFATCMSGLRAVGGDRLIDRWLAGGRPVLGICVGMQILFETGVEHGVRTEGLGHFPGTVERLEAPVLPHMGWDSLRVPDDSHLLAGVGDQLFYFVHSYGVRTWEWVSTDARRREPVVSWCDYNTPFIAAIENGPLVGTQFHPEKSADAGAALLATWVASLPSSSLL